MNDIDDRETGTLRIAPREAPIQESDKVRPGVIAEIEGDGGVGRFEVLRTSRSLADRGRYQRRFCRAFVRSSPFSPI